MGQLKIIDLHATVAGQPILKGINLTINTGEIHAIMGPNGTGKSTLANVVMGFPNYEITQGTIWLNGQDIRELTIDARARAGLFLAMQYPVEVPGVTNAEFIRAAINARRPADQQIGIKTYLDKLAEVSAFLDMAGDMTTRYLNEGFSGGEKKRNEILQLMMLQPEFAILDEIDSGLDIDALKVVAKGVNAMRSTAFGSLMITHYQRLLDYITPDFVHIMMDGRIVTTGGAQLAKDLEKTGYAKLRDALGLEVTLTDEVYE